MTSSQFNLDETEWNQAIAYHMRIDGALRLCHKGRFERNNEEWLNGIEGLYFELYAWMKPEERKTWKVLHEKCSNAAISKTMSWYNKKLALGDAEAFLRQVMHDKGMDLPKKLDPKRALLNG